MLRLDRREPTWILMELENDTCNVPATMERALRDVLPGYMNGRCSFETASFRNTATSMRKTLDTCGYDDALLCFEPPNVIEVRVRHESLVREAQRAFLAVAPRLTDLIAYTVWTFTAPCKIESPP